MDNFKKTVSLAKREADVYQLGHYKASFEAHQEIAQHLQSAYQHYKAQMGGLELGEPVYSISADVVEILNRFSQQFSEQSSKWLEQFNIQAQTVVSYKRPTLMDRLRSSIIKAKEGFLSPE